MLDNLLELTENALTCHTYMQYKETEPEMTKIGKGWLHRKEMLVQV